jgi:hypothetical protein
MWKNERRNVGIALVICAIAASSLEVITRVLTQRQLDYALSYAVGHNDIKQAAKLLNEGANPDAPFSGYRFHDEIERRLHPAAWQNNMMLDGSRDEMMTALLMKHGAKPLRPQ